MPRMKFDVFETDKLKSVVADGYTHIFSKESGASYRYGKTVADDPTRAPAPELLDIEIGTVLDVEAAERYREDERYHVVDRGCNGIGCYFCYKGNNRPGCTVSMSLVGFKQIFKKLPQTVCQIAFGITSVSDTPDLFRIMEFVRSKGVIPNVTVNGVDVSDKHIEQLKALCGAVSVSVNRTNCHISFDCARRLLQAGMKQVNIHYVVHAESIAFGKILIDFMSNDALFKNSALVLLTGKDKNCVGLTQARVAQYAELVAHAAKQSVRLGFDSCGAHLYSRCIADHPEREALMRYVEPCEAGLFSYYINTFGIAYPCSFVEDRVSGESLRDMDSFMDIWDGDLNREWSCKLNGCERRCPIYKIGEEE